VYLFSFVIQFRSNIVFTLSLLRYRLDELLANERKNARLRAQRAAKKAEDKLVRWKKRNKNDRARKRPKNTKLRYAII